MGLKEVGVEAVVKGLAAFQGDMRKINSSLQGVRGEGTLLQRTFGGITDAVLGFGEHVVRIAEIALGVLLRDAIRAAIDFIGDLIGKIIEAGSEFQTLQIRLTGFNLDAAMQSTDNYTEAMGRARDMTAEQMDWLQSLSAVSPFDPTAIANIFTMARAYGFSADEAKQLTKNTVEYTAAMGLGNEALESVIRNLGQMKSRGKITNTELRDLARSAFLPLDDVLGRVAEKMGITTQELQKLISTPGEGVPFEHFMDAFNEMIEQEPRFIGAAGRLSRAFEPAVANVGELATSIGGLNIVTPILDFLGEKVAGLVDEFVSFNEQGDLIKTDKWVALQDAASRVGDAIVGVMEDIFGLMPSTEGIADRIVTGLGKIADWIEKNRPAILEFIQTFKEKVSDLKDKIVGFIEEKIIPAWEKLTQWYDENKERISEFFTTVGEIAREFFQDLTGGAENKEPGKGILETITEVMQYVIDNKEKILEWIEILWSVFIVWQVISTVLSIVGGILLSVGGFILGVIGAITGIIAIINIATPLFAALGAVIGAISLPVLALIAAVALLAYLIAVHGKEIWTTIQQLWFIMKYYFEQMMLKAFEFGLSVGTFLKNKWEEIKTNVTTALISIRDKFVDMRERIKTALDINWGEIGRNIVQGIANGITSFAGVIANAARSAAQDAYNAALSFLGIHSPSKLFFDIGANTMEGMAQGIQKAAGLAAGTMQAAMARVASQAVPSTTNSTTYNNTSNYNLTVNSGAQTEPIIQDFNMMSSLAGV